jgi:transcriptional regulator with XRE-family HTH domain
MPNHDGDRSGSLAGHARRRQRLRQLSLERAQTAPPLARALVELRAKALGLTRLEFARSSGIPRSTLRDLELGVHWPTRRVLQHLLGYCESRGAPASALEKVRRIYAGAGGPLGQFLARLELKAGSARDLARRVGISPATLWEYHRGNYPLPWDLLQSLCKAVGEDPAPAEPIWHQVERERLMARGYPEALAEFWARCARAGFAERHLLARGLRTAAARRLRYLELPPWREMDKVARAVCCTEDELRALRQLWLRDERQPVQPPRTAFGARVQQLRNRRGITRRELADLFDIGGRKPARIIKVIEEDGLYSAQAYPAGLAALLAVSAAQRAEMLELWRERRRHFHRRRRPETRVELRLTRETYGLGLAEMEPLLGYSRLEYERLERGIGQLLESAQERILDAIHRAGSRRVAALLQRQRERQAESKAWQVPTSVVQLITLLARREGGLLPLRRFLRRSGVRQLGPARLRSIAKGVEVPSWPVLERIGTACGVLDLMDVKIDWRERYRAQLDARKQSPLGSAVRLVIAEQAATVRAFSAQLGLHSSLLIRDLQRLDRDEAIRWSRVERILRAAGLLDGGDRWQEIRTLLGTAAERRRRNGTEPSLNGRHRPADE